MSNWIRFSPLTIFRFKGRIARAQFWFGNLIAFLLWILMLKLTEHLAMIWPDESTYLYPAMILLLSAPFLAMTTIAVQRWHDRNKSGWLILPFVIVPATIGTFGDQFEALISSIIGWLVALPAIWIQFESGLFPGTVGPNRYGPDPLRSAADDSYWDQTAGPI